ncbi:hypothetical protein ACGFSB_16885 [Streptomyces sp. NPDC048441]|uniref:hypothetical protein n=1 Tax=Streptomyces sp. NPDC048441 TaxID=3365552 RepID=UPI0037182ED5
MNPTAVAVALPDAVVRMVRAVAGRRVLQVLLLLAGLLVLGFLCGERAQAADGLSAPDGVERVEPVRDAVRAGHEVAREAPVKSAAEPVVRTVRGVVRPVLDEATGARVPLPVPAPDSAPPRGLPEAPAMPELPSLPKPGPGDSDGPSAGDGGDSDAGAGDSRTEPQAHKARKESGARGEFSYGTGTGTGTGTTCPGGRPVGGVVSSGGDTSDDAHRTGHEPFPAPGDPGRTLSGQAAGDGNSTRHGDPGAASLGSNGAPVRLLQGAGASQVAVPIRDRHRDILEFPG